MDGSGINTSGLLDFLEINAEKQTEHVERGDRDCVAKNMMY